MGGGPDLGNDVWPTDDGWLYPDLAEGTVDDPCDVDATFDDDLVSLHALSAHLFDGLDPLEHAMVTGRFGLAGARARTMKELQASLGLPRAELRTALGGGIAKMRAHLADP